MLSNLRFQVFKSTFTPPTRYGSGRTDKDGVVTVEVDDPPNTIHKKWVVVSDHAGHILVSPLNGMCLFDDSWSCPFSVMF